MLRTTGAGMRLIIHCLGQARTHDPGVISGTGRVHYALRHPARRHLHYNDNLNVACRHVRHNEMLVRVARRLLRSHDNQESLLDAYVPTITKCLS